MTDSESFFDSLLDEAISGNRSLAECVSVCQQSHPELVEPLKLAVALRAVSLDKSELDTARANIRHTLDAMLDSEDETYTSDRCNSSQPVPLRRRNRRWLPLALCAAILAAIFLGNVTLASASADALPGSPLYAVKRAEEDIQLRVAWSSQRRSEVLAQIAIHRLTEARAEAGQQNISQALVLMKECNVATRQLVDLVIQMHHQHQDSDSVKDALARTLQAEYDALTQARTDGQTALAQALTDSVSEQHRALNAGNVVIPPVVTPVASEPPYSTQPAATEQPTETGHVTPTPAPDAQQTATVTPTVEPHPTPPSHPTPAPQPTPGKNGNGGGTSSGGNPNGGTE